MTDQIKIHRSTIGKIKYFFSIFLDDILLLAGCGLIIYGLSILSAAAAWIGAGIILIIFAVIIGKIEV